jgi:hypothetical protein
MSNIYCQKIIYFKAGMLMTSFGMYAAFHDRVNTAKIITAFLHNHTPPLAGRKSRR